MMLFRGNTFSLQVSIQDVPQLLWSIKPFTTCQVGSLYLCVCVKECKAAVRSTQCTIHFQLQMNSALSGSQIWSAAEHLHLLSVLCSSIRTLYQFPVFLPGHIKASGQQQGHSRRSLQRAISPTHTHAHPYNINYDHQAHTHTHTLTPTHLIVIFQGVYMLHVLPCPVMFIPPVTSY